MKIEINIPDSKQGDAEIDTFIVTKEDEKFQMIQAYKTGRYVSAGIYKRLKINGETMMSNTPDEIYDHRCFIARASGSVLINGLGLGVCLTAIMNKPEITDITVIESNKNVIDLVAPYFTNPKIQIIHADAFEYKPPKGKRYNYVWHDIWLDICGDNYEEMKKLHRKYGKICDWQDSWCKDIVKRLK